MLKKMLVKQDIWWEDAMMDGTLHASWTGFPEAHQNMHIEDE